MKIRLPDRKTIQARIEELRQELRKLVAVHDALKHAEPPKPRPKRSSKAVQHV